MYRIKQNVVQNQLIKLILYICIIKIKYIFAIYKLVSWKYFFTRFIFILSKNLSIIPYILVITALPIKF